MGHYSTIINEDYKQEREEIITQLRNTVKHMNLEDLRYIKKVITNIKEYKAFEKQLRAMTKDYD